MSSNDILIVLPSLTFSGHEMMAIKITSHFKSRILFLSRVSLALHVDEKLVLRFGGIASFFIKLIRLRVFNRVNTIFFVSGSPYGYLIHKLLMRVMGYQVLEYTPMPELEIMRDKKYHVVMGIVNRVLIDKRVLIDDWQVGMSSVDKVIVVRNFV